MPLGPRMDCFRVMDCVFSSAADRRRTLSEWSRPPPPLRNTGRDDGGAVDDNDALCCNTLER